MQQKTKQKLANADGNLAKALEIVCSLSNEELQELANEVQKRLDSTPIPEGKYLTVEEVGEYLKLCRTTVWRYSKNGILKPRKVGNRVLFARADIDDYLKNAMSHE